MARYHVGTSGWMYKHWKGDFYPAEVPTAEWLPFYSQTFRTTEINATFYRMPLAKTCQAWHDKAPSGFVYAVKVSRFVTHIKRLKDCAEPMANFMERIAPLRGTLGPLLYQLPPTFKRDDEVLDTFLDVLPRDQVHVIEFRHASWYERAVLDLLDRRGIAFCVHDYRKLASPVVRTGPVAYIRFHGTSGRYSGDYPDDELEEWAKKIRKLGRGAEAVYCYFNNDVGGHAVRNAQTLERLLPRG